MKKLFFIVLSLCLTNALFAIEPQLIVDAEPHSWTNPVYSNDGKALAFATLKGDEIWSFDLLSSVQPSRVARGDTIARRFVFEPNQQDDRVVYPIRIKAHPEQPVRLLSTSINLFDPSTRTNNLGEIRGPYLFENQVWYRSSLESPFYDYEGNPHNAGPCWNRETKVLWVRNEAGERLYTSPENEPVRGFEISPDGNWVVVVAKTPEPILYLVSLTTGERTDLGAGRWPSWSLNSKYLACLVDIRDETIIRVHNIEEHSHVALDIPSRFDPEYPALDPNGTKLAFTDGGRIFQVDLTE